MKKLYYQYLTFCYLFLMLSGSAFTGNAQVIVPFKERTSSFTPTTKTYHVKGNFTMMGNTNLTLQNYGDNTTNGSNAMKYVDIDGDNTTLNSSSSTLVLPTDSGTNLDCSKIVYAGLYWTGRVSNASTSPNTFSATNGTLTKTLDKRKILFKGPSASGYNSFTATDIYFPTNANGNMFTAYAEVTTYVKDHGAGPYFAADIAATQGSDGGDIGKYAGWALIVVYENSSMKNRDITIFDGHAYVRESQTVSYNIPVSGFNSVASGPVGIKLGIMAGEGDVNYTGDYFKVKKRTAATDLDSDYISLSRTGNSTTNFFNSSIFTGGNARTPSLNNNSGIDISMFDLPNSAKDIIGNNQTSTTFRYGSTVDTYTIFAIAMAVDAYVPEIEGTLTATTINGAAAGAGPYNVLPGQEMGYKLQLKNKGSEAIQNTKIVIPIPYNAAFVAGSLTKTVNSSYPTPSPNALTYEPTVGANGSIVWDFGTLALPTDPNTVLGELTFKLKSTENCALLKNSNCSNVIQVNGLLSGKGVNSTVTVTDKPFILGYTASGTCSGVAIAAPLQTTINTTTFIDANCQSTPPIIAFTFCNGSTTIPITDVTGSFPPGSTFYNAYPIIAGTTTQYTINNPFPATVGTNTYYAIPPGATGGCFFQFTITVQSIGSSPIVSTAANYCVGDVTVPLSAAPTNPSYTLYYYLTNISSAQQSITPSSDTVGQFTYYVAEGISNACIGPKTPITVNIYAKPNVIITAPAPICSPATTLDLTTSGITAGSTAGLSYTYWTDAGATIPYPNYTAAIPGTYYIKGTNPATNCYTIKPAVVTKSTIAITEITASHTNVNCYGQSTGSISVNSAAGGVSPYNYSWKKDGTAYAGTTQNLINLGSGSYEVTVSDANGCTGSLTIIITQPTAPLTASISSKTDVNCKGSATGSATASAVGGTGTYSYSWNTNPIQTSATANYLPAGTYILTVTDEKGCTDTETVIIAEPELALTASVSLKTDVNCKGSATGTATASAVGGTGTYTYSWNTNPVQTSATANNLIAGTYIVTVTDEKGCTDNETVIISESELSLTASISSKTDINCKGNATGSATASAVGGTGTYSYSWNTNPIQTSAIANNLSAGTYILTVTDEKGCTDNETVIISEPELALTASISSKTDVSCKGSATGSATASAVGGTGTYTYSWNTNPIQTSATANYLSAGTYIVTVTDEKVCTDAETVIISEPELALTASVSLKTDVNCKGSATGTATASAVGGTGTYTYSWNTNPVQTSATANNLIAGTYIVTVTDEKGCTDNETVIISEPELALTASVSLKTDVNCKGSATGNAMASAVGGTGTYSYSWNTSPIQTSATANNLSAGTYIVTVTDEKGCTDAETVIISEPELALTASVSLKTDVNCKGGATGSATASAVGGTGTYTYSWNTNPIQTSTSANNLIAGTYIVTVTDEKGCTDTEQVIISEPELSLTASISSKTDVNCKGSATGSATASAVGGTGTYTYSWNTNPIQTSASANNLSAGTYIVTVTDEKGCTDTEQVIISEPELALTASISSKTDVNCKGNVTGSATASAVGGTGTYTYSWNTNPIQTSASANNLSAGTYIVTVTDEKGCTDAETVIISEPELALTASISSKTDVSCKGNSTGSATASAVGGTGTYSYSWNTNPIQTSATANNLIAGTYIVTVTDEKGCTDTEQVIISEPEFVLSAAKSQVNASCGGASSGSASVVVSGGTAPYSYSWNTVPTQTSATANNLIAGNYSVIITDFEGCTRTETFEIIDGDAVKPVINPLPETSTINCPAEPVFAQAIATDNNGTIASLTFEDTTTPGNCAGFYTKTRTWTAADACGNISLPVTQTIIVQDTTAPTWSTETASLNRTIECSNAEALASAQALFPIATDSCDGDVSNILKVSGQFTASEGCSNAGTITNTWTVKDDCGNTSGTFTQVIKIQDTTAPTWTTETASLNRTVECSNAEALASAQALFPTATDACDGDVSNIIKVSGKFTASEGCSNAGTITNTWTVKDNCGNTSGTFTQIITIQDTTAPTWSTETASLNRTIECSNAEALASAQALFPTATDSCDSDVSDIIKVSGKFTASEGCSNAGTITNTWTVKDDCGNTSGTFTQVITIQDTTAPTFIGDLPSAITVSCDAVPEPANVEASDNCNGNLPIVFTEIKSNIQNECASNYTLTRRWTTSDCGGNTASFTQIITVRDTTAPTGTAPAAVANLQSIAAIPAGSPEDIKDVADNCSSTVTITINDTNNGANGCDGNAYILTRTYTLTDCAGNKTDLVQTFTVENKVSVSGIVSNVTCFGGKDGLIMVTNSPGSTVIIRNENNDVVGNTNLPAGTYTLTATAAVNNENQTCTATATVMITQPAYTVKISGQIINKDTNTPIANVPVTLIPQGTTTGPILLRVTGANGMYAFSGMAAGSYLVQVQDANLNSAHQLYPVDSSLFFTTLEDCKLQEHNFEYGTSTLPVLGDYVWYDTNSNGIQDEWYDANNDGVVTKNIPDSEGAVTYSQWEWIDFNGDGSYAGPQNAGELNAGGFGNALTPNVIVDGPNGYHKEVIVGIQGFWRERPETANPYGQYTVKLVKDANLDAVAATLGATDLVKVLPSVAAAKKGKTAKSQLHTVCQTTSNASYLVTVTPEDLVHLDIDFGVNCKVLPDIAANDDSAGPIAGVNNSTPNVINVFTNDTLEGTPIKASDVIITTVTPNEFLQLNPNGSVDILPNAPVGTLTLVYQICEADQTSNCDTATVTITIEAPVMTVTATSICVNDVPYIDYVVTPVNFTPVNGVTIAWASTNNTVVTTMKNLPLKGRVLWPGAVVDQAGKGIDWPGWIFENNKWIQGADGFESLRPAVNLTVSVNPSQTIVVNYPPADPYCTARPTFAIAANDDNAGPITGNTANLNVLNVYNNDTLNGTAVNPADLTLTTVTPDPKGALTLNANGSVDVAANTPVGTYTLTYQICEKAAFGNCDTAIVTVTVVEPIIPLNANDDTYANIGCNTFGLVGNVLSNDLKGTIPVTMQLVNFTLVTANNTAKTDPNIIIDASGNVTVSSLTPAGTYTYTYQICEKLNPTNCDTAAVTITVLPLGTTTISSEACADDTTLVDLLALLPENTPKTGTWIDTNTTNALQGNLLNAFGLALGNYAFEYKITDQSCPRSIFLTMAINDDCKVLACGNVVVHNAFSPNGDGINDVFTIDNIDETICYPENTVEIYNRWGILVFETTNYNNSTNAFDGNSRGRTTVKQSDGLPTGTYFYIINYKSLDGNNVLQNNKKDGYLYLSK